MFNKSIYDFTEFDEQSNDKEEALAHVARVYVLYRRDEETYGVLSGYQDAAMKHGATWAEIQAVQKRAGDLRDDLT